MKSSLDNAPLMSWQSTILTYEGWVILALLSVLTLMLLLRSKNKKAESKLRMFFGVVFGALLLSTAVYTVTAVSFLVNVELGWKLSVLAGSSVVLGTLSMLAMLYGAITNMSTRWLLIWLFLSILCFGVLVSLFEMSSQKISGY